MTKNNQEEQVQYNFLRDAEDHHEIESHEIDYDSLTTLNEEKFCVGNSEQDEEKNKKYTDDFDGIVFYCRDCKHIVEVSRAAPNKRQKIKFKCNECASNSIFYGTKRGVEAYFHIGS